MPLPNRASFIGSFLETIKERIWMIAAITAAASIIGGIIKSGSIEGALPGIGLIIFALIIIFVTTMVDYIKDSRFVTLQ